MITDTAADKSGNIRTLQRTIVSKLPSDVVVTEIGILDKLMVLYKLPPDGKPEDIARFETDQIKVTGLYSDGAKRSLTSSVTGTTYKSSNEKIVTVSPEGKVTAQQIGKAKITVRNDKLAVVIDIIVKPFKR